MIMMLVKLNLFIVILEIDFLIRHNSKLLSYDSVHISFAII